MLSSFFFVINYFWLLQLKLTSSNCWRFFFASGSEERHRSAMYSLAWILQNTMESCTDKGNKHQHRVTGYTKDKTAVESLHKN